MKKTNTKYCTKCEREKPLSEFGKNKAAKDGLTIHCKSCQKAYRENTIAYKKCSQCQTEKTVREFTKAKDMADGLSTLCKECKRLNEKRYRTFKELPCRDVRKSPGIDSWNQVDSVLREMAELQLAINNENKLRQHRIGLINRHSDEAVEPLQLRQVILRVMLESFINENREKVKGIKKYFNFGIIRMNRNKVEILPNMDLALKRYGKP